jgi:signal transduction histidine kinase
MKMAQMQLDYEKELRTVQHEVQEQVLTNVSRELHDNIGQLLTVMHLQIEQKKMLFPEVAGSLAPVHDTLGQVSQQVKLLGRSLSSDNLEQNGLLGAIAAEVARLQQFNHLTVHWVNDNAEPVLNKDQKLMAFRIFQEMLNNSLKHAGARNLNISLFGKSAFRLVLSDDGVGFDVDQTMASGKGAGLRNIIKRAALSEMRCSIVSDNGTGSIFTLENLNSKSS